MRYERRKHVVQSLVMIVFAAVCLLAFAIIPQVNANANSSKTSGWLIQNTDVEIAGNPLPAEDENGRHIILTATPVTSPEITPSAEPVLSDQPTEETEETTNPWVASITITAVGDCTLGGSIDYGEENFDKYVEKYGYDYFLSNFRDLFVNDNITVVNLEGPLTTCSTKRSGRESNYRGKPANVNILSGSGVDVCNVANDHSLDYGADGLNQTTQLLNEAGIGVYGFSSGYTCYVDGYKVCFLGFTEWQYTEAQIATAVKQAKANCDILIVSMHWGDEDSSVINASQRSLGQTIINAGADLVLGNHSKLFGGIETYKGKYIVYSLGGFCDGSVISARDPRCIVFQQTFHIYMGGEVADGGINIVPAAMTASTGKNDFHPVVLNALSGAQMLSELQANSNFALSEITLANSNFALSEITLANQNYISDNGLVLTSAR